MNNEMIMTLMLQVIKHSDLPTEKRDELLRKQILIFKDLCKGSPDSDEQATNEVLEAISK